MGYESLLKIDYKLLPKVRAKTPQIFENVEWQTQLNIFCLNDLIITSDALLVDNYDGTFRDANFHGIINFYSQEAEIKNEFKAKYTDGKLVSIIEVKQKADKHWR